MAYNPHVHINKWLLPLSWLYGLIVCFRNRLFAWGILKQETFDVPVICIGNITVGGTGKTPHTELLIRILHEKYKVAVLSRGYKRKTSGFVLAAKESTSLDLGDEPFQIKQKFPEVIVAVDADRRRGIRKLLELNSPPNVILLDDAFQHRYVKPSFTILMSNYNRPMNLDRLLPAGRLREPASYASKANMIIVSKCPDDLKPIDYRIISHEINAYPYQDLFFTTFAYKNIKPVFVNNIGTKPLDYLTNKHILLVTGIASPIMIKNKLKEYASKLEMMTFPDHHNFTPKDIDNIQKQFDTIESNNKIIIVTEKDASRLILSDNIKEELKSYIYYLPIEVVFMDDESKAKFKHKIYKHVRENSRNRIVHKKQTSGNP